MKHLLKSHHTLEIKLDERDLKGRDLFKRSEINCAGIGYGNGTGDGATFEFEAGLGGGFGGGYGDGAGFGNGNGDDKGI